ncbi:MAG: hypothetical protein ABIN80_24890 [Dyadobacter sp.]|uniref:hypothetical protein n=1 Tax=Dyadobacter sp. TaxID=1914288 RepID=UPI003267B00B
MTAVVGILNKTAVALAADSAVTVTGPNQNKIYNTANKIFKLSKYHPVGIAIYGSAELLTTPWEIIIKSFRESLGNDKFNTLLEYRNKFIEHVQTSDKYLTQVAKGQAIRRLLDEFIRRHIGKKRFNPAGFDHTAFVSYLDRQYTRLSNQAESGSSGISSGIIDDFINSYDLQQMINQHGIKADNGIFEAVRRTIAAYFQSGEFFDNLSSGLVFAGYGDNEIFPSLQSVTFGELIGNEARWVEGKSDIIDDSNSGSIVPFAQTDVMEMMITGIHPYLTRVYHNGIEQVITDLLSTISGFPLGQPAVDQLKDHLSRINVGDLVKRFNDNIQGASFRYYIEPTVSTVAFLSKEDLSDLAENLIYMTYMKRRIMSAEESVGGPIDVAIISKTDGFIWMKRKYYFKQDLNPHFFHIYYKEKNNANFEQS